jgi:hypothetical protein
MDEHEAAAGPRIGSGEAAAPVSPAPPQKNFDALIERWWADHFPGSAVAAYTQAWNTAYSAKEALKTLLRCGAGG